MSQPRPTLSSPSRECPVVDGVRQIQRIAVRNAEVGGIPINRALPTRERRTVGAWCFLDHAGPTVFNGTSPGMDVGAHPCRAANVHLDDRGGGAAPRQPRQ